MKLRRPRIDTDDQAARASRSRRRAAHLCALIRVSRNHHDEYLEAFLDELRKRIPEGDPHR